MIRLISDIHLDLVRVPDLIPNKEKILVIAGDLCSFTTRLKGLRYIKNYLEYNQETIVIYVLGNHEYYGSNIKLTESFWLNQEKKSKKRLFVIGKSPRCFIIKGIRFICCTLWTDLDDGKYIWLAYQSLNDFKYIDDFRLDPKLYPQLFKSSFEKIDAIIKENDFIPTVIITHHPPSKKSALNSQLEWKQNRLFYSQLDEWIKNIPRLRYWLHGHIHSSSDYYIKNTRVICNPFFENNNFNNNLQIL